MKTRRPALPPLPLPGPRRAGQGRAVAAYSSAPSAPAGGTMEFRVSAPGGAACSVAVRRIGTPVPTPAVRFVGEEQGGGSVAWVRVGAGDLRGESGGSDPVPGPVFGAAPGSSPDPLTDGVGVPITWCDWEPSLLLDIPESWPPGLYVARFSVEAPLLSVVALRGRSANVPFVVRGPLAAGFPTLVILPFAAYAAANPWPAAHVRRSRAASLDRPFAGDGLPAAFAADASFVEPLADTDFATSLDLHAGLVDPSAYRRVLFRADLWSPAMRTAVTKASLGGTDVGGLDGVPPASVDFVPGPDGRRDRILIRY